MENKIQKLNDFLIILQNAHTTVKTHRHAHTHRNRQTDRQAHINVYIHIFRK